MRSRTLITGAAILALLTGASSQALSAPPAPKPAVKAAPKAPPKASAKAPAKTPPKTRAKAPAKAAAKGGGTKTAPAPALALPPEEALKEARRLSDAGDSPGAYALLTRLVASPGFAGLSPDKQHAARYLLGGAAMNAQKYEEAHAAFKSATDSPAVTGMDWFARGATASAVGDDADMVFSLTRLARDFPAAMILAGDDTVSGALAAADRLPDGDKRRFDLMEALFDAHWKAKDPVSDFGDAWRRHALELLAKGQDKRAAVIILSRVGGADSLIALRADRRFDALAGSAGDRFNIAKAANADLATAWQAVIAEPLRLAPINAQAAALYRLGRAKEALTVVDDALIRALPDEGESPYRDQGEVRLTLDIRARALMALGRRDEAEAAMKQASALFERGGANITQVTALAWLQLRLGKPKDALASLSALSGGVMTSPQILAAEAAQACALKGNGDAAGATRVLADMKTRKGDAPGTTFAALICVGDVEGAAAFVVERLGDANGRAAMLAALQDYIPAGEPTAVDKDWAARRKAVLAKPAVQKALAAAGRIEVQPVAAPFD